MATTNIRDLTIDQRVTRIQEYAKLGDGGHTARMELMEAQHDGWMKGFDERGKMAGAFEARMRPLIFAYGLAAGVLLMLVASRF